MTQAPNTSKDKLQQFRTSDECITGLLDRVGFGYMVTNLEGNILEANKKAAEILSYKSKQELLRKNIIHDLYVLKEQREVLKSILQKKESVSDYIIKFRTREGGVIIASCNIHLLRDSNDEAFAFEGTFQDVTRLRKITELQDTFLRTLRRAESLSISETIQMCVDESVRLSESQIGYYHLVNPDQETIKLTEWSTGTKAICKVEGKDDHYPIEKAGVWVDCIFRQEAVIHNDYQNLKDKKGLPEGHVHLVRDLAIPIIEDAKIVAVLGVGNKAWNYNQLDIYLLTLFANFVWHIIQRKEAIEELRNNSKRLSKAKKVLRESERHLKKMNATKDKLFSIISHDLKSPFNAILGCSGLLYDNIEDLEPSEMRQIAKSIYDASEANFSLLSNLLDWSRTQTNRIDVNPVALNLQETIRDTINLHKVTAKDKGIQITSSADPGLMVFADPEMFMSVLRNLISNGIKFTRPGGKVDLNSDIEDKMVVIRVSDNGVGISKGDLDKLFRLETSFSTPGTEKEKGTGLGLFLCKDFVTRNGGKIWITSEVGKGSTISFTLPKA